MQLDVASTKPGSTVSVEILRDGEKKSLDVTVKQLPGTDKLASADSSNDKDDGTLNGVEVSDLDSQARQQFNVPKEVKGAVVTQVDPNSAAPTKPSN
jgi:serine protease Do